MPVSEEELRANPRLWFTDGSIAFIEQNLRSSDVVMEFGGGWSTIWWAKRTSWVTTVEADYIWAAKLLQEMAAYPELMAKWSLRFVACAWSNFHTAPKKYWSRNTGVISKDVAERLKSVYMAIDGDPDVIAIDGSARGRNVIEVDSLLGSLSNTRMIILHNMEWLHKYTADRFSGFRQYDFPEYDLGKIPLHQNGN